MTIKKVISKKKTREKMKKRERQLDRLLLGILKMSFSFQVFTRIQGSVLIKAARKANI